MIQPHAALEITTPDEVGECWDGIYGIDNLYETLWGCVPLYKKFDREDCGPHDVIGMNAVSDFWDRFTPEQQTKLNELAVQRDEWLNSLVPSL